MPKQHPPMRNMPVTSTCNDRLVPVLISRLNKDHSTYIFHVTTKSCIGCSLIHIRGALQLSILLAACSVPTLSQISCMTQLTSLAIWLQDILHKFRAVASVDVRSLRCGIPLSSARQHVKRTNVSKKFSNFPLNHRNRRTLQPFVVLEISIKAGWLPRFITKLAHLYSFFDLTPSHKVEERFGHLAAEIGILVLYSPLSSIWAIIIDIHHSCGFRIVPHLPRSLFKGANAGMSPFSFRIWHWREFCCCILQPPENSL
jgi:hypothetical protein